MLNIEQFFFQSMHLENRAYIVDALAMFVTCTDLHRKTYTGRKK